MKRFRRAADIKVGVIGYGGTFNMGKWHLNEMQRAGMTPRAVVEIDPERLKAATADFPGIETYFSVGEMLGQSDVNLVTLITPHNTHAPPDPSIGSRCPERPPGPQPQDEVWVKLSAVATFSATC